MALLFLLAACDTASDSSLGDAARVRAEVPTKAEVLVSSDPNTYDYYLLQIAERAPGFAGLYEEEGQLRVAVARSAKDPTAVVTTALAASDALLPAGATPRMSSASREPAEALYGFDDVMYWRSLLTADAAGIVYHDADERHGVVRIGVEADADVERLLKHAQDLGIPEDGLEVSVSPRLEPEVATGPPIDIRNYGPYLEGGYGISMTLSGAPFGCTLGFMAFRGSSPGDVGGFVTNSHCTRIDKTVGGVDNIDFYQGGNSHGNASRYLGREVVNPALRTVGSAPRGEPVTLGPPVGGGTTPYRYSDAAFVDFDLSNNSTSPLFGQIVKTRSYGTSSSGSLIRSNAYDITSTAASYQHPMGSTVNKVGATTGWTRGPISQTCTTIPFSDIQGPQNVGELRCQYLFTAHSNDGDSGSPIYVDTGSGTARLQGLHWGGNGQGTGVYSPFDGVNIDLRRSGANGSLYTHGPSL